MRQRLIVTLLIVTAVDGIVADPAARACEEPTPISYVISFTGVEKHKAEIEAAIPTENRNFIELMMPIWSPGFYRIENYADRVECLSARSTDGSMLAVVQPRPNHWRIQTEGAAKVIISYRLLCDARSVTRNWVGDDYAVLNGPATFITLTPRTPRTHDVRLDLPRTWKQSTTSLASHPDRRAHHYRAPDYDTLVDSPIVAGDLAIREFEVDGSKHIVAAFGDVSRWDGEKVSADLEKIVREHRRFWGSLPFQKYVFLCALRQGGGGLEHLNSTLVTTSPNSSSSAGGHLSWLGLVCHEYFHAWNVKRLRPVELGPFDYDAEPRTGGLWVGEGLTSYYGDLLLARAGLAKDDDFLGRLTGHINQLQNNPGRLVQTLEQSSLEVLRSSFSGIGETDKTVSYYVKGPVVGFLLDGHIRKATDGEKSLDDVMRLAFQRHSGAKGFTADQFRQAAEDVAGVDLKEWFRRAISSTEELDYAEALEWFGLEFTAPDPAKPERKWKLSRRENASAAQRSRLKSWLRSTSQ
jgi:predicted metalloprotease with PDZ domain